MGGRIRGAAVAVAAVLCLVTAGCDVLPRHPENGPDNPIDIMVVGDSYTAGNNATTTGADGYYDNDKSPDDPRPIEQVRQRSIFPGDADRGCFRNHNNYGEQLYRLLQSTGSFINAACSGAVGLTRTSITNIESGNQKMPLHVLVGIARGLETTVADLVPAELTESPRRPLPHDMPPKTAALVGRLSGKDR